MFSKAKLFVPAAEERYSESAERTMRIGISSPAFQKIGQVRINAREEDVLSAVYYQLKQYIDHHFITKDQYKQEIQRMDSIIEAASLKYEEATDFSMKQYEKYVMGEGSKEAIAAARPAKEQAEAELNRAIADKEAYEKQYQVFFKLLKASRKEVPLSEIIDCIERIVVDVDRKIMVKWTE